jgi:hypothetical protein
MYTSIFEKNVSLVSLIAFLALAGSNEQAETNLSSLGWQNSDYFVFVFIKIDVLIN